MITRILLILFLLLGNANAAIKYLRSGATGNGSGDDWTNAYTTSQVLEANLRRGDTAYIAEGAYTGWPAVTWNEPASGTTLITVIKATVANHGTNTGWNDSYGDGQAVFTGGLRISSPYWVWNGQTGGGPTSWRSGYGFKFVENTPTSQAVLGTRGGGANLTLSHMELVGCYSQGGVITEGQNADGINCWDGSSSNCTFSYMWIYDVARCPIFNSGNNNTFEFIYTGRFGLSNAGHSETISSQRDPDPGGGPDNITIRWNLFASAASTGGILTKGTNYYIYGNVFIQREARTMPHGFHGKWDQKRILGCWAWNNSYLSPTAISPFLRYSSNSGGSTSSNIMVHNAIFYDDAAWSNTDNFNNVNAHNYNHFAAISGILPNAQAGEANGSSSPTNPFVNIAADDFGLTAAQAAAIPAGQTISGAPYNTRFGYDRDMFGNVRGADNKWDRGAIEFVSTAADVTAPTIVLAVIDAEGDDLVVNFGENVNLNNGAGMSLSPSGIAASLSNAVKTGSAQITWDISRTINSDETAAISYATTANGIEDAAGNDLAATVTPFTVTNNSTQGTVVAPQISLAAGYYYGTQNVTLTPQTVGSTIRYTTDGTDPTSSTGNLYSTAIPVSVPTELRARAFKSGSVDSTVSSASYWVGTWIFPDAGSWIDFAVPQQTGIFTWRFRAMVPSAGADTVVGLGPTPAFDHWDDTAVALRFRTTNVIDCINGAGGDGTGTVYQAVNVFPYAANATYEFVVTVKVPDRTYSATVQQVAPTTGAVTVIATDYEFRNGHEATADLDNFGALGLTSETTVSNMSFGVDTTAPTPNPMTFVSNPTAVDNFSVTMTATTATDDFNNPVNYYFEETSGNAGATDSGWQPEPVYTDVGLTPGTQYSYYVWARDNVLNQGSPSATLSATTPLVVTSGSAANCETLNVTTLRVGP